MRDINWADIHEDDSFEFAYHTFNDALHKSINTNVKCNVLSVPSYTRQSNEKQNAANNYAGIELLVYIELKYPFISPAVKNYDIIFV